MTSGRGLLSRAANALICGILRASGVKLAPQTLALSSHDDLHAALELVHQEGRFDKADRDRRSGLLALEELEVSDVMRHRTAMRGDNADDGHEAENGQAWGRERVWH